MSCLVPCCCLVAKLCLTPCNPMNCSTPGFPVLHLPELAQTRPLSRWYHPIISSSVVHFSSYLLSFPASGSFPVSQLFASGGQSTGALALASVLPMNIQGLFPLGLTVWISLQSKGGLSRVFSSTAVWKHQFLQRSAFFMVQLSHPYMTAGKKS